MDDLARAIALDTYLSAVPKRSPAGPALANFLGLVAIAGDEQVFQAKGVDGGVAGWATVHAKTVSFR